MSEALEKFNYLVEILGEIFNSEKTLDVVEEGAQEIKPKENQKSPHSVPLVYPCSR